MYEHLPNKLIVISRIALLGELYPAIRAIACRCSKSGALNLMRYYLDREPTEFDLDSIEMVHTEVHAAGADVDDNIELECIYSQEPMDKLDPLSGFIYARREY